MRRIHVNDDAGWALVILITLTLFGGEPDLYDLICNYLQANTLHVEAVESETNP